MVLRIFSVPGRPSNLENSRARAYWACSRYGRGSSVYLFILVYHFSLLSPSLWRKGRYCLKYLLKGPFNPKQQINQSKTEAD